MLMPTFMTSKPAMDGKKKKGRQGKKGGTKGAKGRKRGKEKKGKLKKAARPELPADRPPTPPTFAEINKLVFDNETDFFNFMSGVKFKEPTYVLFWSSEPPQSDVFQRAKPTGPPDSPTVEEWMQQQMIDMERHHLSRNINYIVVHFTSKQFAECYARFHPAVQLNVVPTIMRWDGIARLEGEELLDERLFAAFLAKENERNTATYIDDGSVCPFYSPPPPELEPSKPKKKKGKKKKGKKKKGKKKKGKEKKGKGRNKKKGQRKK